MDVKPAAQNPMKMTEIGEIPEDWELGKLGSICAFENGDRGKNYPNGKAFVSAGVPFINAGHLTGGKIDWDDMDFISEERFALLTNGKTRRGDILFCLRGSIGKFGVVDVGQSCGIASSLVILRPLSDVNSAFVATYLASEICLREIANWEGGAAQPNLSAANLCEFRLALPPNTAEQQAIAEALSDADDYIRGLEKLVDKMRAIKQGAMQELLTGRRRLPGFDGEWSAMQIGQFANTVAGGTPSTANAAYWNGSVKWMSSAERQLKKVFDVKGRITDLGLKESSAYLLPAECVLIGLAGQGKTRGTAAINYVPLTTNQSIGAILPSNKHYSPYLFYCLDQRYEELRELSSGDGGRGGLNLTLINKISIALPSMDEQKAIAEVLSNMDDEITVLVAQLDKAKQIKQAMMQELLTGRIRLV